MADALQASRVIVLERSQRILHRRRERAALARLRLAEMQPALIERLPQRGERARELGVGGGTCLGGGAADVRVGELALELLDAALERAAELDDALADVVEQGRELCRERALELA